MSKQPNSVNVHVGAQLRRARKGRGLSMEQLSEALGLTYQQVQKYETGANRISAGRLWDVCQTLKVAPSYFFEGLGPIESQDLDEAPQLQPEAAGLAGHGPDTPARR